jgi:hypothetical protein
MQDQNKNRFIMKQDQNKDTKKERPAMSHQNQIKKRRRLRLIRNTANMLNYPIIYGFPFP